MWQQSKCLGLDEELVLFISAIDKEILSSCGTWMSFQFNFKVFFKLIFCSFYIHFLLWKAFLQWLFLKVKKLSTCKGKVGHQVGCPSVTFSTFQEPLNWFQSIISWHTSSLCKGVSTTVVHLKIPILFKVQIISKH